MVVATVDQRDADRRAPKPKSRFQPAEPGPDDHHAMEFFQLRLRFGHVRRPLISDFESSVDM
jgi:hypothetical protein